MRGLTIAQPYAELVALGVKTVETRSRRTSYRGPLVVHAGLRPAGGPAAEALAELVASRSVLEAVPRRGPAAVAESDVKPFGKLPRGAIVAVAELVDVLKVQDALERFPDQEPLGVFTPGRYGWVLEDVRRLGKPIPWKGSLGLWRVPPELVRRLEGELGTAAVHEERGTDVLARAFERLFSSEGLRLPAWATEAREAGTLHDGGWVVHWVWGERAGVEYLELYSSHRMAADGHIRLWADGREEPLEALSTMWVEDPDDPEGSERRHRERNRRIARDLAERGLLPGLSINQYLALHEVPAPPPPAP